MHVVYGPCDDATVPPTELGHLRIWEFVTERDCHTVFAQAIH